MGVSLTGPHAPKCSDEEFIRLFPTMGARALADHLKTRERNIYQRRRDIETKHGIVLTAPSAAPQVQHPGPFRDDLAQRGQQHRDGERDGRRRQRDQEAPIQDQAPIH